MNGVAPGPIWTPLIPSTFDDEKVKSFGADTPMKRPGQPNEVAPAFLFLASEDSSVHHRQLPAPERRRADRELMRREGVRRMADPLRLTRLKEEIVKLT